MHELIDRMDTSPLNWANQIGGQEDGNALIGLAAKLARPLDGDTIRRAIGVLTGRFPVLAGRFVAAEPPYWQLAAAEPEQMYREYQAATGDTAAILQDLLNGGNPGNFRLTQAIQPDQQALLILTVHHALTDGGGLKVLWQAFLSACNHQATDDAPPQSAANRQPGQVLQALGDPAIWRDDVAAAGQRQKAAYRLTRPEPARPAADSPNDYQVHLRHWSAAETSAITAACHQLDVTLTGYLAADILNRLAGRAIQVTVDLRRYLTGGGAAGPANLSGMEAIGCPELAENPGDRCFRQTLLTVSREMQQIKTHHPGVASLCQQIELPRIGYGQVSRYLLQAGRTARQTGLTLPILSNVGRLAGDQSIAGCPISQLFLLPAGFALPAAMLGVSSWNGRLTATLVCRGGFCPSALDPARLFSEIDR